MRTAIDLKASLTNPPAPDQRFVTSLFQQLADEQRGQQGVVARPRPFAAHVALIAACAAALVGVTVLSTETLDHRAPAPATATAHQDPLRTGTLLSAQSQRVGQITIYRGDPSWVFMNIEGSSYDGKAICKLQADHGVTVASGSFEVDHGSGQFARTLRMGVSKVQGAEITTPAGAVVAKAVFSQA